jgi:hypothetical protein
VKVPQIKSRDDRFVMFEVKDGQVNNLLALLLQDHRQFGFVHCKYPGQVFFHEKICPHIQIGNIIEIKTAGNGIRSEIVITTGMLNYIKILCFKE